MTEKRRFQRCDAVLDARYTKSKGLVTLSALSKTKNISLSGLCLKLSRAVSAKDTILIEIKLIGKMRIAVLARIAWMKTAPDKCSNICGLKFLWISSREILNERLSSLRTTEGSEAPRQARDRQS